MKCILQSGLIKSALFTSLLITDPANAFEPVATLTGFAKVVDGDGIKFGKVEVRLRGIAAPEYNEKKREPGGSESSDNLKALVDGKLLVCLLDGSTTRGRPVGVCYLGQTDIGEYQVLKGHARDCARYSGGKYAGAEKQARAIGHNLRAIYKLPGYCGSK